MSRSFEYWHEKCGWNIEIAEKTQRKRERFWCFLKYFLTELHSEFWDKLIWFYSLMDQYQELKKKK